MVVWCFRYMRIYKHAEREREMGDGRWEMGAASYENRQDNNKYFVPQTFPISDLPENRRVLGPQYVITMEFEIDLWI